MLTVGHAPLSSFMRWRLCSTRNSVAQKEEQNFSDLALFAWVYQRRLERHFQFGAWGVWRFLYAVELAIRRHDAGTGSRTHVNPLAQKRSMNAILPKQGIRV